MTGWEFCSGTWWIFPSIMIVFFVICMARGRGRMRCCSGDSWFSEESALDILNKRFARGEIDQEEYDAKREKIKNKKIDA